MTVRKYGQGPCEYVVVHGGPGAPGSVSSLARKLSETITVLEPFQTETSLWGQVEELYLKYRDTIQLTYGDREIGMVSPYSSYSSNPQSDPHRPAIWFGKKWGVSIITPLILHQTRR